MNLKLNYRFLVLIIFALVLLGPREKSLATESYYLIDADLVCSGCSGGTYPGYTSGNTGYFRILPSSPPPPSNSGIDSNTNPSNSSSFSLVDIFDRLPFLISQSEDIGALNLGSFSFIQVGERTSLSGQSVIKVNGQKYLTIAIGRDKLPPVLKTIGMTVFSSDNSGQAFSFVLKSDNNGNYSAMVAPLKLAGLYPFNIHIIDFHNQRIKKLSGFFQVSGVGFISGETAGAIFNNIISPIVITSGVLAGASQVLAISSVVSIYDIYLLILRGIGALFDFLGIRRKRRPWGTVFDSVTKRPIDPAYVTVYRDDKKIASAITDIDGRYGFLVPSGVYRLTVEKTHYHFPSRLLAGKTEDELYSDLYFGGPINIGKNEPLAFNVPLDPVNFDWNEFSKGSDIALKRSFDRELIRSRIYRIFSTTGLVFAVGVMVFAPSLFNLAVLLVYLGLRAFGHKQLSRYRGLVVIRKQITGEPIPFAIVRVFLAGANKEVKTLVADQYGRIYFLVRPGAYYLTVDKKLPDGSYFTFFKTEIRDLPNGVWSKDVIVYQFKEENSSPS